MNNYRLEKDELGEKEIPINAYYGIKSLRAKQHFSFTKNKLDKQTIKALGIIKKSYIIANRNNGLLDDEIARVMIKTCDEIIQFVHNSHFIVASVHAYTEYSVNMNINEIIANRSNELLGFNPGGYELVTLEHSNKEQNYKEIVNSAIKIACIDTSRSVTKELIKLKKELRDISIKHKKNNNKNNVYIDLYRNIDLNIKSFNEAVNELRLLEISKHITDENYNNDLIFSIIKESRIQLTNSTKILSKPQNYKPFETISKSILKSINNIIESNNLLNKQLNLRNLSPNKKTFHTDFDDISVINHTLVKILSEIKNYDLLICSETTKNYNFIEKDYVLSSLYLLENAIKFFRINVIKGIKI